MAFADSFIQAYRFRHLYLSSQMMYPIMGAMRHSYGNPWEVCPSTPVTCTFTPVTCSSTPVACTLHLPHAPLHLDLNDNWLHLTDAQAFTKGVWGEGGGGWGCLIWKSLLKG